VIQQKRWSLLVCLTLFVACLTVPNLTIAQEPPVGPGVSAPASAPSAAAAPTPPPKIDKGDTAWLLTSSALVLMMTIPGLFLFYGGLVRRKNVLGTIMHSFIIVAVISI
jgi:Amt family ammonium transporter